MEDLQPDQHPDFCVKVNFKKGTDHPERVFRATANLVESLQSADLLLARSVDSKIKPVLLLEKIDSGSVKIWMKQFLQAVDDEALKNLDWKPAVGKYLVQGKHRLINYLGQGEGLKDSESLHSLSENLHKLAEETDVRRLPGYRPASPSDLAQKLQAINNAATDLEDGGISIESDEGSDAFTPKAIITPEQLTEILSGESITNEVEKILIVRRPDFLGDAMWEFRHEKKSFSAKIVDEKWVEEFRNREHVISPGDALRVMVLETFTYGKDGDVIAESRVISEVKGVLREKLYQLPMEE